MIVTITRPTTKQRRQRWTFGIAPLTLKDDCLTLVLEEYAVEVSEQAGRWTRPKLLFYRRRTSPDAQMPLAEVPMLDDESRVMVLNQLCQQVRLVAQLSDGGLQRL